MIPGGIRIMEVHTMGAHDSLCLFPMGGGIPGTVVGITTGGTIHGTISMIHTTVMEDGITGMVLR